MTVSRRATRATLLAAFLFAAPGWATAQQHDGAPVRAPAAERHEIVLYRDGPAEVTEARPLDLTDPAARLVAADLPEGAHDDSLSAALLPANGDLRHPTAVTLQAAEAGVGDLLARLVGEEIRWLTRDPASGTEAEIRGILRAASGGRLVVERDGGLEVLPPGRLRLDPDLALSRSATVALDAPPGASTLFLRYATDGLAWDVRYEAVLAEDGSALTLAGDYLIRNASGHDYRAAALRLVAGDVPRVAGPRPVRKQEAQAMMATRALSDAGPPTAEPAGDRQVFAIADRVALAGNSTVRRPLMAPVRLPADRRYVLEGQGEAWPGRLGAAEDLLRPRVDAGRRARDPRSRRGLRRQRAAAGDRLRMARRSRPAQQPPPLSRAS